MKTSPSRVALLLLVVLTATSCVRFQRWQKRQTQQLREIELEDVAKSWCQTIRASQVVPVYPLTEDLQPGDIFLVQSTVEEQHKQYTERGFLPLDYHLARLDPEGYPKFYDHSVFPGWSDQADHSLPSDWTRPDGKLPTDTQKAWALAPRAAFPSYSFDVTSGGGFSLAIPVQGVPVGMSLMASQAASGTVNLSDARTLGVDLLSLTKELDTWSARKRTELASYASSSENKSYLRVLTRVYVVGGVDISLTSSASAAGGVDAGQAQPVSAPGDSDDGQAPKPSLAAINKNLENLNVGAGGSLRVTAAGKGSVSMKESFDPPLVIGYLGFDCEILPGGALGPPVPSRVALEQPKLAMRLAASNRGIAIELDAVQTATVELIRTSCESEELPEDLRRSGVAVLKQFDDLADTIPDDSVAYTKKGVSGVVKRNKYSDSAKTGYAKFKSHKASMNNSARRVRDAQRRGALKVIMGTGNPVPAPAGSDTLVMVEADLVAIEGLLREAAWTDDAARAQAAAREWYLRLTGPEDERSSSNSNRQSYWGN